MGGGWGPGMWGGNWYRGGWGGNGFWGGFGLGTLTGWGLGAMTTNWFQPAVVGVPMVQTMGVYDYFPTWSVGAYDGWGLGSVASTSILSGYSNPYYASVAAAQPAVVQQTSAVYDYSRPINVAAPAPEPDVAETNEQVFSAARNAFKSGDYNQALTLVDQVLKKTPDVPVIHEFRALVLFAMGKYDEAATVLYAVLSAGPGWNWETLVGLYPDIATYTNQIRALEAVVKGAPTDPASYFLLAYHYMVQGHNDAAAAQFEEVVKRAPEDKLSASFVKALKKSDELAKVAAAKPAQPPAAQPGQPPAAAANAATPPQGEAKEEPDFQPPPPPPASLHGKWTAKPNPDLTITLTLDDDAVFTWEVDSKGQKQSITGMAGYKDDTLGLFQQEGPPLSGKVSAIGPNSFTFSAAEGDKGPALTFTR